MPPEITAISPGHFSTGTLINQNAMHIGALLESLIDDALGADNLATTLTLIGSNNDLGTGVNDTVTERVGGETGENDRVDSANARASQESNHGLWNHRKVDSNSVTLLDALLLQGPSDAGDFTEQLSVGNIPALIGLIGLVDDGNLVGVLYGVAIHTVKGSVQATSEEPGIVAILEGAVVGGLEIAVEMEVLASHASPESVGLSNRLLVQLLVLIEVLQIGSSGVFFIESLGNVEGVDFVGLGYLYMGNIPLESGTLEDMGEKLTTPGLEGATLPPDMTGN